MPKTNELDSLIVKNIADLDATAKQISLIETRVWNALAEEVEAWAKDHEWLGEFDEDQIWLAPSPWQQDDSETCAGSFYFGSGPDDTESEAPGEPYFWLSRYLGQAGGDLCLWFDQKVAKPKVWRPVARSFADELARGGVYMSDACNFFIRCSLDPLIVAEGLLNDDLSDAVAPIRSALDIVSSLLPTFQQALDRAGSA
ncbi:hypothetical protein [Sinorhizobium psoraleae]|uniref:Phage protein n=1 Tax=Sinorhizobium psoraleae TaxID=520838 RepID=A0ABT4KNJ0_9HYPH|nr:hypothetical protein [Sinorhizobium psoraleae]MCZ4093542.1 hypothetical protein [Sinorhizobium psoraleae]